MDDFRLRVFITAAKTLNFTKCAEQLYISQPAVSKHIGELESRYKVQLFERSGSRLALTEAGRVMLEHAERIADGYRRLQYEMDLFTDRLGGELKVGASTTIAQYVLPQVLARFTARFPEVKVSLVSGNSEQVEAALARHDTDLGLVESSARHPGFHYEPFIPDELVLIASTKGRYGRCPGYARGVADGAPGVARKRFGNPRSDFEIPRGGGCTTRFVACSDATGQYREHQEFRAQQRRHGHRVGGVDRR